MTSPTSTPDASSRPRGDGSPPEPASAVLLAAAFGIGAGFVWGFAVGYRRRMADELVAGAERFLAEQL